MFNRISIKHRLIGVLTVVTLGFFGIGLAYQAVLSIDDAAFAQAGNFHQIGLLTERIHRGMRAAQAAGYEFSLTHHLEAVTQYRTALTEVRQNLVRLSHYVTDEIGRSLIERIDQSVHHYQAGFEHVVQLQQLYGLDAESGYLGELHQAARAMEEVIKQYGAAAQELWTSMLIMRRNEKDYIAYRDPNSLNRMPAERTRFEMFLEGGRLLKEDRDAVQPRLNDYYTAFGRLVELVERIDQENEALKKALDELEPILTALQQHKDRLLEQGQQQVHAARLRIGRIFVGVIFAVGGMAALLLLRVLRSVWRPLGGEPAEITALVKQVANGDLNINLSRTGQEQGIYAAVGAMINRWRTIVTQVGQAAHRVGGTAGQLVQESTHLAQRTEAQATALEKTAASMEQLTAAVSQNAEHAAQAEQLAHKARSQAEEAGQIIQEAINSMNTIHESNRQVATIISMIDEIACQTNLLALNAAVEAARAGAEGRGFAVVAGEVRRLAQRTAEAARQIKNLITQSTTEVQEGARWVHQSGQVLQVIITEARKVADLIAQIAVATREEAIGIEQVNQALRQLDQGTQQNSQVAEKAAAASMVLLEQAAELRSLVGFFKFEDTAGEYPSSTTAATASIPADQPDSERWLESAYAPA